MLVDKLDVLIAVVGCWVMCDGIASLYTYTAPDKREGQTWWRDHSLRVVRCLLGIALIVLGAMIE